jgi:hypothetical protein
MAVPILALKIFVTNPANFLTIFSLPVVLHLHRLTAHSLYSRNYKVGRNVLVVKPK